MTTVVGIDPSLTSSGLAVITDGQAHTQLIRTGGSIVTDTQAVTRRRIRNIRTRIMNRIPRNTTLVAIEGRSYGHNQSGTDQRVHLAYLLGDACDHLGIPVVQIPPSNLKKWATDNGNASKTQVLDAMTRMWPHIDIQNHDAADALALATINLQHLGQRTPHIVQERHKLALAPIDWPPRRIDTDTVITTPTTNDHDRMTEEQ